MATKDVGSTGDIDGAGLRVVLVRTRWNPEIIERLADGVMRTLVALGVASEGVTTVEVPGAFEIPFACRTIASSGRADAIVAIGAVIRGETTHYDLVSEECARGLQDVQIQTGVPIGFGVLATENVAQAEARSESGDGHNVGADAAQVAVEMALLARDWS